jgi:hypothetical protein
MQQSQQKEKASQQWREDETVYSQVPPCSSGLSDAMSLAIFRPNHFPMYRVTWHADEKVF